jgi:transaldolase
MGASFRNKDEILSLAGCDKLTISPQLLEEMTQDIGEVVQSLDADNASSMDITKIDMDEKTFRWMMNEDAMATEKLAEGIRNFTKDIRSLEEIVSKKMKIVG